MNDNQSIKTQSQGRGKLYKEAISRIETIEHFLRSRFGQNWASNNLKLATGEYLCECKQKHQERVSRMLSAKQRQQVISELILDNANDRYKEVEPTRNRA